MLARLEMHAFVRACPQSNPQCGSSAVARNAAGVWCVVAVMRSSSDALNTSDAKILLERQMKKEGGKIRKGPR